RSLPSANGPSLTNALPSRTRTRAPADSATSGAPRRSFPWRASSPANFFISAGPPGSPFGAPFRSMNKSMNSTDIPPRCSPFIVQSNGRRPDRQARWAQPPAMLSRPACRRPVELEHRRWSDLREHRVERGDLPPGGVLSAPGARVHGGDRRLQRVRSERSVAQNPFQQGRPFFDLRAVPARPVLLLERDDVA